MSALFSSLLFSKTVNIIYYPLKVLINNFRLFYHNNQHFRPAEIQLGNVVELLKLINIESKLQVVVKMKLTS